MDLIQKELLEEIADLHGVPAGAYNIRANGAAAARNTTANIDIVSKDYHQAGNQEGKRAYSGCDQSDRAYRPCL